MAEPTNPVYAELERIQNNLTALHDTRAPGWVSAPNMRGTSSILYSCLLTLFACIYSALHLNVPKSGSSFSSLLLTKLRWCLAALFVPEFVLYYASSQFSQARKLAKFMRELHDSKAAKTVDLNKCVFDLKWGFFAVMGGFEMASPDGSDGGLQTLSVKGVRKLAGVDIKPFMIPRSLIDDRSKADTLQKAVVLLQVGWMALQCIARKIYGLPLTLLELHTMVHVVCAIVMYTFWLKKPLDLRSAEVLDHDQFKNITMDQQKDFRSRGTNLSDFNSRRISPGIIGSLTDGVDNSGIFAPLFYLLPLAYGGVHLSAWNFEFPTSMEGLLWKISGIYIAVGLSVSFVCIHLVGTVIELWTPSWTVWWERFAMLVDVLISLGFMLSRVYIVVEAFVSLRAVPIGVYWTPSWIQMIPHV